VRRDGDEPPKPRPVPDALGLRLRGDDAGSTVPGKQGSAEKAGDRLDQVQRVLAGLESAQIRALTHLLNGAETRLAGLREALREAGLNPDAFEGASGGRGMGGPWVPFAPDRSSTLFEAMVGRLQASMGRLDHAVRSTAALPFISPIASDRELTSGFGYRIDPFTRGPAMHTGLDFRVEYGEPVRAAGAGYVIAAEYAGGYGNMVEIDHGNGVATRYAHLSSMSVGLGQTVTAGEIIGRAGSSGRSTGPHLHYETRIHDEPVDPQRFLRAAARLAAMRGATR
jgi:murein DD-endopeptidase MepM/ murein hydrolase activator NlpD